MSNDNITMNDFTDDIPAEFTDEDIWFFIFTKPMLAVALGCVIVTVIVSNILKLLLGIFWPSMIIGLIASAVVVLLMKIPYVGSNVLRGGGDSVFMILLRKFYRKKHREIFVKGWKDNV